ncbi:UDP-glucose:glycoprotein glucosyltransferase 1 isoform X2 [Lingula anatina]|uniref:UDP-glucose:glycoprotein glucosyltransferase 1 isoform X2 n=1 Tax=Lingula anatina TaxID=7574 RepID=A0A1S3JM24_LINAN|nr:UDP-glucose:glycoprotein glucosyltransferase 1 isoform X2 [Lingula anatina]|eukprot:XP_013410964.1 UDP-glucose:glycoprotein glucosyltransferase 1 isoform X2 [Lingula anatina]
MAGLVLLVILVLHACSEVDAKSKFVSVSLDAKWESTPLMLETSEFLAKESNAMFWAFVDTVAEANTADMQDKEPKEVYEMILSIAEKLIPSKLQLGLLKFSLSLRSYSPAVEMHNQVAKDNNPPRDCDTFVDVQGKVTCDSKEMKRLINSATQRAMPELYPFDHHFLTTKKSGPVVILYTELGTSSFNLFHGELKKLAKRGMVDYVLRHFVKEPSEEKVRLAGYGVELAIKSTEYKAKDDTKMQAGEDEEDDLEDDEGKDVQGIVFSSLRMKHPDLKEKLKEFKKHLMMSSNELSPLKVWQLQDLSFQTAEKVLSSADEDMLETLQDLSQNFPSRAMSLAKVSVKDDMRKEVKQNQKYFEQYLNILPGESALFFNGLQYDLDISDVFTLLDTLRADAKIMEGLYSMGIKGESLSSLLKLDLKETGTSYAVDIRNGPIQYINDLEKDRRYQQWPSSVQDMLRPTFPGMLRHVAKNFFTMVFMVDPSQPDARDLLKMAESFYVHNAPIRLGLLFVVNNEKEVDGEQDAGVALYRAFNFVKTANTVSAALSFLTDVFDKVQAGDLTADQVVAEFRSQYQDEDVNMVFSSDSDYDDGRISSAEYFSRIGLTSLPQVLLNGVPLKKETLNQDSFEEGVVMEIMKQTPDFQKAVYKGELTDRDNVLDWIMEKENVLPRLNDQILDTKDKRYLQFGHDAGLIDVNKAGTYTDMTDKELTASLAASMVYMKRQEEADKHPITMWVVADLSSPAGRAHLYSAVRHLKHSHTLRVGIVHNPRSLSTKLYEGSQIPLAIHTALGTQVPHIARSFVTKLLKEDNIHAILEGTKSLSDLEVHGMVMEVYLKALDVQTVAFLQFHSAFCTHVLGFEPGARGVIVNGRIIGPLKDQETFIEDDYNLLEKYTLKSSAEKIVQMLTGFTEDTKRVSDMVMQVGSLLMSNQQASIASRTDVQFAGDQHSVLKIPAKPEEPAYDVTFIVDPVSREAQKVTPLLRALLKVANLKIQIFMNCREKLSEMPLKNYYRYVIGSELEFSSRESLGAVATFHGLPQKSLLTLNMNPPEGWLVEAVRTQYDLDNIMLDEVDKGINAEFELEYLLLEGHCHDQNSGQPPRGLQFVLGTRSQQAVVDTIVMANLGYFQLKAKPGAWMLQLRHGRSEEIYKIASHERTDSPPDSPNITVVMNSFLSKIIKVKVSKKPGRESDDLLGGEEDKRGGLWDSLSSSLSGPSEEGNRETKVNIFSVASGHLYERFLRIMMLSVVKNTKSKIKFWFLKNYLSPTFKEFIPYYAREYGFEYELVQYKWPRWLHQQTEKQRIIWGYKILFLDVLFPLDVEKIIFVDADQVVRADIQELYDLDLGGAPYGYTPFCDSRKEMDGFRFWKSGYWASHLAGRKYHISALYVVDLKRFRKIAAGDRLRGQYQGLSQDPNSLSNLDQDLPNNMIHQVNIKSLPQEWLWCETWCSDDEKSKAKTIDLCNNPQTKEPKLNAAKRIVAEWEEYDNEARRIFENFTSNKPTLGSLSAGHIEAQETSTQPRDEL